MLGRYKKIEGDSRFSAAEDRGQMLSNYLLRLHRCTNFVDSICSVDDLRLKSFSDQRKKISFNVALL